jgi:hypothetical protein
LQPFLVPDDFRAFMQDVVRCLDAPGAEPALLDAEDALQHETGYGGRTDSGSFRFTYLSRDGRDRWIVELAEAAVRDIADGLLIEVMGERIDLARATQREPKGHPLLIWGEYGDDALVPRDRSELMAALDTLHALAGAAPRMLRLWSATDDQIVAMIWRDDCALYVVESHDGYATSCGDTRRKDAFELVDYDGQPYAVPYHDCVPWPAARDALLRFVERGDLGSRIRIEGRIPTGLLMMGELDRAAVLAARVEPPRTVEQTSLMRMLVSVASGAAPPGEETLDEAIAERPSVPAIPSALAAAAAGAEPPARWARRLIELLWARDLLELRRGRLDSIAAQLGELLAEHGAEAQQSHETAEWLARRICAIPGIFRLFATPGDLQIALRRSRAP